MQQFKNTNIISAIGNTPIIRLNKIANDIESEIYVKLEYMNPGGSIKDRMGVYMCQKAYEEGKLKPGGVIVECTSGNTGVGVCLWAITHGFKTVFVMADKQSQEKINNLKSYGAKVIICPTNVAPEDPSSYYSVAAKLASLPILITSISMTINTILNVTTNKQVQKFSAKLKVNLIFL